jgi:hypothetical protein
VQLTTRFDVAGWACKFRTGPAGLLTVCLACLLLFASAGCGSSNKLPAWASPSATAKSIDIRTVTDKKYGFRLAYPVGWVGTRYQNPKPGGPEGTLQYVVAYADPKGAQAGGSYIDSEQVAVYQLERPMRPDDLTLSSASRLIWKVILKDMDSVSPRSNVTKGDVAGVTAWQVSYEFAVAGDVVIARSALVVKGRCAYWLTMQSGTYSYRTVSPTLATCFKRFRLK